ncbi:hypothetical protein Glove_362g53 [Diversispora epigaea]|uniref:HTH CENPB-type domain-containing protein n=1 Tax=Diversispora epigaea TaxID=1348612 RepID=A0A397HDJ3_9GLOM|nr:hypothetical protein Glove_362g53 [Diversispora epigaea]
MSFSNGWLESFKNRLNHIPNMDIYNTDETELFYLFPADISLATRQLETKKD